MAISEPLLNAINTLQQGDASGFDIIYNETFSYVHCRAKMIMKDEDSTNDLVQDTYIQAYQSIGSLLEPQSIFAWLGAITYRQGMKRFRNNHEVLLNEDSEELFEQIESDDMAWNPEQAAEQKAVATIVAEIIEELPAVQKAALTAFYYDNLKIVQIADMFECSTNTIKSRLNYAKKYLREQIEIREKRDQIRLHSIGGSSILLLGLHELMAQAQAGIAVSALTGNLSAIHAALPLSEAGTNAAASAGATAVGKTVFTAKTALITIGATVATVLVVATSIAAFNGAFSPKPASSIIPSETVSESSEDTQVSEPPKIMDTESQKVSESENTSESQNSSETEKASESEKNSESQKNSESKKESEAEKSSEKKAEKKSKKKPKKESSDDDPFGDLDNPDIDVTSD